MNDYLQMEIDNVWEETQDIEEFINIIMINIEQSMLKDTSKQELEKILIEYEDLFEDYEPDEFLLYLKQVVNTLD